MEILVTKMEREIILFTITKRKNLSLHYNETKKIILFTKMKREIATTYSYGSPVGMNQLEAKRLILLENMSLYSRPQYMANAPFIRIM